MSEEIENNLWSLLHLNTYLDLNNEMKEKCEIPREVLKRWFENSKVLLDLYQKEKKKNKDLWKAYLDVSNDRDNNYIRKDKVKELFYKKRGIIEREELKELLEEENNEK